MTCKHCNEKSHVYCFDCRSCLIRWLSGAVKQHAKSQLEHYRKKHGKAAMMELIAEVKAYEKASRQTNAETDGSGKGSNPTGTE